MDYVDPITARLEIIEETVHSSGGNEHKWLELVEFARDMRAMFDQSEYGKDITITTWPLDMVGRGSISFQISFMPSDVYMKVWYNEGYYIAFFKVVDGYFDAIIRNTFDEEGVVLVPDLDSAEESILTYLTMELYKWKNKKVLPPKEEP